MVYIFNFYSNYFPDKNAVNHFFNPHGKSLNSTNGIQVFLPSSYISKTGYLPLDYGIFAA